MLRHSGRDDGGCGLGAGSRQSVMVADWGGGAVNLDDGLVCRDSGPDSGCSSADRRPWISLARSHEIRNKFSTRNRCRHQD